MSWVTSMHWFGIRQKSINLNPHAAVEPENEIHLKYLAKPLRESRHAGILHPKVSMSPADLREMARTTGAICPEPGVDSVLEVAVSSHGEAHDTVSQYAPSANERQSAAQQSGGRSFPGKFLGWGCRGLGRLLEPGQLGHWVEPAAQSGRL